MKEGTKALLGIGSALAAVGGILFIAKKAQAATPKPAPAAIPAAVPVPQAMPRMPEVQVSPGPQEVPSYQNTPPEQWTQEQASQATSDAGNQARDAVGKLFGFGS